jgi:hypothetical protein
VKNDEVLQRVKEDRNILQTRKEWKAKWIFHILLRKCLLKHVTEGKIEGWIKVTAREGKRDKQLLNDFKEMRRYWKLINETLDRTL